MKNQINDEKLNIYFKYNGDIDAWAISSNQSERKVICDEDWFLINELLNEVELNFLNLLHKLKGKTENEIVAKRIIHLAIKSSIKY